ncbi:MAG TPA: class I SAM-dependent methyltransferase [Chthoniobacteraceae bacterium]|nr:class I SAM-dependent methyltransferase [Chthoniobacteraceae bacterium]
MQPEDTGRSYDTIAGQWRAPHLQTNGIAQMERALRFAAMQSRALDIGCGCSGRFADLLMKHGFHYEGIDVSEKMIALAKETHPHVAFHHADISTWKFPRKYDFILAWDSTWHLPLEQQEPVMKKICKGLAPGGVFIFTTGGVEGPHEMEDSNMGPPVSYSVLGIPATLELLKRCGCACRHLEYDQYPEPHVYIIAQKT